VGPNPNRFADFEGRHCHARILTKVREEWIDDCGSVSRVSGSLIKDFFKILAFYGS
jgi:hypothetical protein